MTRRKPKTWREYYSPRMVQLLDRTTCQHGHAEAWMCALCRLHLRHLTRGTDR